MAKILIVEDNEMNRDLLDRKLRALGYSVLIACDGEQGHALARSERPDLIVMDVALPGVNGLQVTRLLKNDQKTRRIPVIVLTAHSSMHNIDKAFAAGCDDYATKPIAFALLHKMIENLLSGIPAKDPAQSAPVSQANRG